MQRAIFGSWHLRLPLRKADWSSKSSELMWTVVSFLFGVHDNNTRKECVYVHLSWGPSISALFCTLCKKSPCHNSNAFGCSKTGYTVLRRHSICFFLWPNRAGESFGLKRSLVRGFFFFYGAPGCSSVVNQHRNVPGIFLETAQCTCGLAVGLFFSLRAVRSLAGHVCVVKRQWSMLQ